VGYPTVEVIKIILVKDTFKDFTELTKA